MAFESPLIPEKPSSSNAETVKILKLPGFSLESISLPDLNNTIAIIINLLGKNTQIKINPMLAIVTLNLALNYTLAANGIPIENITQENLHIAKQEIKETQFYQQNILPPIQKTQKSLQIIKNHQPKIAALRAKIQKSPPTISKRFISKKNLPD